jgi:hypothetical protein
LRIIPSRPVHNLLRTYVSFIAGQEPEMPHRKSVSNVALATAAALLFSTAPLAAVAADSAAPMKCMGGNSCKGKSACSTPTNACSGQNSCKGKGYVMLGKAECTAAQAANKPAEKKS